MKARRYIPEKKSPVITYINGNQQTFGAGYQTAGRYIPEKKSPVIAINTGTTYFRDLPIGGRTGGRFPTGVWS
jgi:hypothetical protein